MADDTGRTTVGPEGSPRWVVPAMVLLGILAFAGLWTGWKNSSYAQDTRHALNGDMQRMKQGYAEDLNSVQRRLTPKGAKLLERALAGWASAQAEFAQSFGEARTAEFRGLLRDVVATEFSAA